MTAERKPRWTFDGLYVWDNSVVGTAAQAPNGYWYAHGCADEWEDVNLGCFDKEKEAKIAVEQWVKENANG